MIIESVASGILVCWLGSMEYRMRKIREESMSKPDRLDVEKLIDLKQEVVKASHVDIKRDVARLEVKIDKLIDLQMKK